MKLNIKLKYFGDPAVSRPTICRVSRPTIWETLVVYTNTVEHFITTIVQHVEIYPNLRNPVFSAIHIPTPMAPRKIILIPLERYQEYFLAILLNRLSR